MKTIPSQKNLLNTGLLMAMEFGKNWLMPINEGLKEKYLLLEEKEIQKLNELCQKAMRDGHRFIIETLEGLGRSKTKIKKSKLMKEMETYLEVKYEWINEKNLNRLYSQSCYYAWKEGLLELIED